MKPILLRSIVAAALASPLLLAVSAPTGAAPPVTPTPTPTMDAIEALLDESSRPEDLALPATDRMERLAAQGISPATRDKLRAAFGTDRLYTIERRPPVPGHVDWRVTFPALRHAGAQGTTFDWTEGSVDLRLNPAGTTAAARGAWAYLAADNATAYGAVRGLTFTSDQRRGGANLWFGPARLDIAGIDVRPKAAGAPTLALSGVHMAGRATEQPKSVDLAYDAGIDRISVSDQHIDSLHMGLRVTHIDKATLAEITALGTTLAHRADGKERTPAEQADALKPLLRSYAKAAMVPGAALDIDDISARYHGEKASLKGRVTLEGATPADLDTPGVLFKKILARFEIRVPIALVREIAGVVVARQTAQQGTPADPDTLARLRQSATDVVVGKLTGGGYARVENEVLVSNIEWRAGALRANGKPVTLDMTPGLSGGPTPQAGAPAASASASASAVPMLQARRVEDSCTLPDYPAEVIRLDQPLSLVAQVIVGADGKVKRILPAKASAYPDYDRAVLVALAQCRYIPALRGGTAIVAAMPFQIERAPGAKHP